MARRLAMLWAILAVVLPVLVGLLLISSPSSFLPPGTQVPDLARVMGLRNIALSVVIAAALLTRSYRALAFLVLARGGQDLADAIADLSSGGDPSRAIVPLVVALISFAAGWALYRRDDDASVVRERVAEA